MAILRCTSPFATWINGVPRVVANDELVDSSDPVVKGREGNFVPVEQSVAHRSTVEQATAAPGEARTVSTRGRKSAKSN